MVNKGAYMTRLHRRDVSRVVRQFLQAEDIRMSPEVTNRAIDVCHAVWRRSDERWMIQSIHAYLKFAGDTPGAYRSHSKVIFTQTKDSTKLRVSDCVDHHLIPQAMHEWYLMYNTVVHDDPNDSGTILGKNPEFAVNLVGMSFRAIQPFFSGNRFLSWVMTNQLCVHLQLPIAVRLPTRTVYDEWKPLLLDAIETRIREKYRLR